MKNFFTYVLYVFLILFILAIFDLIYILYLRQPPPSPIIDPYNFNENRLNTGIIIFSFLIVIILLSIRKIDKKISLKKFLFACLIFIIIWISIFILIQGTHLVPFHFLK